MNLAIWLLFFASFTVALYALWLVAVPDRGRVESRLDHLYMPETAQVKPGGVGFELGKLMTPVFSKFAFAPRLEKKLLQAGMPVSVGEFITTCLGIGLGTGVLVWAISRLAWLGLLCVLIAGYVPVFRLEQKRQQLTTAINDQLPDALMLLINALRAGNGFMQSLQIVASQMPPPISNEFAHTIQDINWGLTIEAALRRLYERVGTVDFEMAITAVLIQRETGGNLSEILTNIHDTIRDRIRIQGEVHALTASGRLSGLVLSVLPTGIGALFYLVNPAYISTMFTDPRGQLVVGAAVVSQLVGILAIRQVVAIKF